MNEKLNISGSEKINLALNVIQKLLKNSEFDYAYETLSGIEEWILKNNHVTEKQIKALENIYNGAKMFKYNSMGP